MRSLPNLRGRHKSPRIQHDESPYVEGRGSGRCHDRNDAGGVRGGQHEGPDGPPHQLRSESVQLRQHLSGRSRADSTDESHRGHAGRRGVPLHSPRPLRSRYRCRRGLHRMRGRAPHPPRFGGHPQRAPRCQGGLRGSPELPGLRRGDLGTERRPRRPQAKARTLTVGRAGGTHRRGRRTASLPAP